MSKIKSALPTAWDVAGTAGAVLVSVGVWMIDRPVGLIVAGVLLLSGAILASRAD